MNDEITRKINKLMIKELHSKIKQDKQKINELKNKIEIKEKIVEIINKFDNKNQSLTSSNKPRLPQM